MITSVTDSHTHLIFLEKKGLDPRNEINQFFMNGGSFLLDAAVDSKDWEKRVQLAEMDSRIRLSAGIHPNSVTTGDEQIQAVERQLKHPLTVAVGETGLDYYRENTEKKAQIKNFIAHLELSRNYKKPIIIHNREADEDILNILKEFNPVSGGIMHCFSSTPEIAAEVMSLGLFISFAGNVTYKNAENIRDAARLVPVDRLLIETDAPFLSPQAVRGKPNRPSHVIHTLKFLADLKKMDVQELAEQISKNLSDCLNA